MPFDNEGWVMSFHHLWVKCNDWYIKWITVASGVHIKNIFFAIILLGLKIVYYKFPYVWKLYELYQWTLYRNELSWPCSFIWHINHDYRPINNETTSENPSLSNRKEHPLSISQVSFWSDCDLNHRDEYFAQNLKLAPDGT